MTCTGGTECTKCSDRKIRDYAHKIIEKYGVNLSITGKCKRMTEALEAEKARQRRKKEGGKRMNEKLGLVVMDSKVVVSSRTVAEVFEKEHGVVLRAIRNLECSEDFRLCNFALTHEEFQMPSGGTRRDPVYHITRKGFTLLAMGFTGPKATAFKEEYIEAFEAMEERLKNPYAVKIPQSFPEALRAYANECEQRALAEAQRDEAIRTKAWIGTRREATAMATASAEKRRAEALAELVGDSTNWKSVKSLRWLLDVFADSKGMWSAVGKRLKSISDEMGYEVRQIEHSDYGHVNAYHKNVIDLFRARVAADQNMLGKYRRAELEESA